MSVSPSRLREDGRTAPVVCCILAGGRGTRLGSATQSLPKPLVTVAGQPFLAHQLELLAARGIRRVVLSIGYRGDQIESFVADGTRFGLAVEYARDPIEGVGTAGALRSALHLLGPEYLVLYGDTYLDIDYVAVANRRRDLAVPGVMSIWHNHGDVERSNVCFDGRLVTAYAKAEPPIGAEWIDFGLLALTPDALDASDSSDLADVLSALAQHRLLAGFETAERFWDIGTPRALAATAKFLRATR